MEFREIAWNDLSADEILTSTISKEQSRIQYGTVSCEDGIWYYKIENNSKCSFGLTNPDINFRTAQRFIIITINTRDDALLGPIVVIVEPNIKQVFGRATRE